MKASEFLIKAKKRIDTPEKWTVGSFAKSSLGEVVSYASLSATCFCSMGAIRVTAYESKDVWGDLNLNATVRDYLKQSISRNGGSGTITIFNDSSTHEEVMKVWDAAITQAMTDEVGA